jgi:hypothetical protein
LGSAPTRWSFRRNGSGNSATTPGEIANRYEEWESRLHPDDRRQVFEILHAYLTGHRTGYAVEYARRFIGWKQLGVVTPNDRIQRFM